MGASIPGGAWRGVGAPRVRPGVRSGDEAAADLLGDGAALPWNGNARVVGRGRAAGAELVYNG